MKKLYVFKKLMALVVAIGMLGSLCACADQTWSVKAGDTSMTMGEYILFEYESYNEALQKLNISPKSSSNIVITNKKIGDQKASDWIKEKTLEKCKMFLYIENKFKEMNLSFTEAEQAEINTTIDNYWGQGETNWEKRGVSKESFGAAAVEFPQKADKVFKAIYGKEGTNPVSDDDLIKYFKDNYMALSVVQKSLLKTKEDGNDPTASSEKLSDDEVNKIQKTYEGYVSQINAGSLSFSGLDEKVKADGDKIDSKLYKISELPFGDEINNSVKSLEVNKASTVKNNDTIYLFVKGSLDGAVNELKTKDESRNQILYDMKKDEFEENAKKIEVTVNESGIKSFPPSMFDQNNEQQQRSE